MILGSVVTKNLAGSFVNKIVAMLATYADEEAGHKKLLKEISTIGDDAQLAQKDRPTYSALEKAHHKAYAQTAEALKQRLPGIRALAKHYNTLCAQLSDMKSRSAIYKNAVIPTPVVVDQLFDMGVDDIIWQDAGLDVEVEDNPPAWLADEKIQDGIKAMLMYE
ncbi:hypothetical protein BS47DRAFT_1369925 [Hydnum rufescens UP504]|uniref:Uncharacterized protein n=1 Tax=Hydnum rufescens UP504 TaxID=1448309 RepID=A0A9P6AD54_9AGAM|nr:hypothetical protein BS47DRAFT_1369925 [Hydnum rufescens UP504]